MNPGTPTPIDWLGVFNTVVLGVFAVLVVLAFGRMFYRLGAFIFNGIRVPVLLKRDLFLFGTFFIVFGVGGFLNRVLKWSLSTNPLWLVPTSLLALGATAYWVWVEYRLESN